MTIIICDICGKDITNQEWTLDRDKSKKKVKDICPDCLSMYRNIMGLSRNKAISKKTLINLRKEFKEDKKRRVNELFNI